MRSLLLGKISLPLLFLSYLHMAAGKMSSVRKQPTMCVTGVRQPASRDSSMNTSSGAATGNGALFSVTQMPATLEVVEGSTVHMECLLQGNVQVWYILWFTPAGKATNTSRRTIITSKAAQSSNLSLSKTEVADSGIYTCVVVDAEAGEICSNGTQLTVEGIQDLMVHQIPERISKPEGANVTLECQFRTVSDHNATEVRWYRNGTELTSSGDLLGIEVDQERGFTSLTLKKAAVSDSGNYTCQVENRSRNLTGSGNASRVVIIAELTAKNAEDDKQLGSRFAVVGGGAGAGTALLLLVVAGAVMWKWRSKASGSEPQTSAAKETGLHSPLTSQCSEVTYADLHFHKKEGQPDAEVEYAEVRRTPRKQQACKDANQMQPKGNQRN